MQEIKVSARSAASPEGVYGVLVDGSRWPGCSPLGSFELVSGTDGEVGAIRLFVTGRVRSREEIVEAVPGRRLSYVLRAGLPLRDYRADIDLEPDGDGTVIRWHSGFEPVYPGTGPFFRLFLGWTIRRLVRGIAATA